MVNWCFLIIWGHIANYTSNRVDMLLKYTLDKIKFGIDAGTWEKAVGLYENGKVRNFKDTGFTFVANVLGTHEYYVVVSKKRYTDGNCTCYLGQNDTLCKHMISVAIYGLKNGEPLTDEEKTQHNEINFSGKTGELSEDEVGLFKAEVSGAIRYVKAYQGPSRTWFAYQESLTEGCNRLASVFSELPASRQTADLVLKTLIRLDRKLQIGGVDDSDGTVGDFIEKTVDLLLIFGEHAIKCVEVFMKMEGASTCFGWEERLLKYAKSKRL